MKTFQQYQARFVGHVRDPQSAARPEGASVRRMRVYTEIVFNNMEATLASCFPVCKTLLGVRRWRRLVRRFLAEHRCATPWFRQIPEEFVRWLATSPAVLADLPVYVENLAHYEWIELSLAVSDVTTPVADASGDILGGRPVLAAPLLLLEYAFPVHHISPFFKPTQPAAEPTRLLVFRDAQDIVRFVEVNAVTARLVQLLQGPVTSGREAVAQVAQELRHPDPEAVMAFGAELLDMLRTQGAILGTVIDKTAV